MNRDPVENLYFRSDSRHRTPVRSVRDSLSSVPSPRPTPSFLFEKSTFSTKKDRTCTPRDCPPPKPPVKSAPPVSRIFPHRQVKKAQPVSFVTPNTSLVNTHYTGDSQQLYFAQCFEIDEKLGCGSFGEVFKVRSRENGKLYAVKRSREKFRGESDRKRKLQEVEKHERLPKHPNCVEFVQAWEEKQHLYIQTELCKGSLTLFADQNHNIPETLIWNYLVDLLMAVGHLHKYNLVHMDIKPDNIFVTEDNVAKLGDFGLVIDATSGVDYSEAQEGDPKYLAPELMQGRYGKPADIFSLGVSMLELASDLDLPRGGDLWHELRSGHFPEEFMLGISPTLRQIIRWMMEPNPDKRPTAEQVLESRLVKGTWIRRRRTQTAQRWRKRLMGLIHSLLLFVMTIWCSMTYPLRGLLPRQFCTPSTPTPTRPSHPPEWDNSFSDDDSMEGSHISIHNNSMGTPLDVSHSSDESSHSVKDADGFTIPSLPVRRAMTTPGQRVRPNTRLYGSVGNSSRSSHHMVYSSSPVNNSHRSFLRINEDITPPSSLSDKSEGTAMSDKLPTPVKQGIEPKNLLDAFEGASSSEEDD